MLVANFYASRQKIPAVRVGIRWSARMLKAVWVGRVIRWVFSLICWETVKDREGWHAAVHGVAKNATQLSDLTIP